MALHDPDGSCNVIGRRPMKHKSARIWSRAKPCFTQIGARLKFMSVVKFSFRDEISASLWNFEIVVKFTNLLPLWNLRFEADLQCECTVKPHFRRVLRVLRVLQGLGLAENMWFGRAKPCHEWRLGCVCFKAKAQSLGFSAAALAAAEVVARAYLLVSYVRTTAVVPPRRGGTTAFGLLRSPHIRSNVIIGFNFRLKPEIKTLFSCGAKAPQHVPFLRTGSFAACARKGLRTLCFAERTQCSDIRLAITLPGVYPHTGKAEGLALLTACCEAACGTWGQSEALPECRCSSAPLGAEEQRLT